MHLKSCRCLFLLPDLNLKSMPPAQANNQYKGSLPSDCLCRREEGIPAASGGAALSANYMMHK